MSVLIKIKTARERLERGKVMFNYERMTELIRAKGIDQKTIAEAVGVSEQAISAIVRGLKDPSLKVLGRIAKVLGCTTAELIIEEGRE